MNVAETQSSPINIENVAATRSRRAALGIFVGAVVDWFIKANDSGVSQKLV